MTPADGATQPKPPPEEKLAEQITNGVGIRLKLIKPGMFLMGSPNGEEGRLDEEGPQHEVEITKPFYMGVYPVTRGQFAAFVKDADYKTEAETDGRGGEGYNAATGNSEQEPEYTWRNPGFVQTDDDPVVEVTWNDAEKFCEWLSRKEKKTYGLPTEAQWEYACRAGTTTRFWCGDTDASLQGNANVADASLREKFPASASWAVAWNDGYPFTSPVGVFKANPWGLYDMHGNVWQWCADYYDPKYYQNSPNKDPQNLLETDARVLRGGSWDGYPRNCRAAFRFRIAPGVRDNHFGCRVALCLD